MKKLKSSLLIIAFVISPFIYAQDITVDEIINNYLENTGGVDNWKALKGIKMTAKVNMGSMELPLEIVYMADGRSYTKFSAQGNDFFQAVYDGEVLWNTNQLSMQPEKADAESTSNFKLNLNDFPDPFLGYKDKGYTVELIGEETVDGADTYKLKLVKEPLMVNGEEQEDVSFYYFDKEAFIPIAQDNEIKEGPQAGQIRRITQSDYDEVEGLYFPFSISDGLKDGPSQPIAIESIEVNPEVDANVFKFPGN